MSTVNDLLKKEINKKTGKQKHHRPW